MQRIIGSVAVIGVLISGCTSDGSATGKRGMNDMETGAIIGAVGGSGRRRSDEQALEGCDGRCGRRRSRRWRSRCVHG
jgi:hypothetical protein